VLQPELAVGIGAVTSGLAKRLPTGGELTRFHAVGPGA
jgi:hypothetical protein